MHSNTKKNIKINEKLKKREKGKIRLVREREKMISYVISSKKFVNNKKLIKKKERGNYGFKLGLERIH